MKVDQMMNMNSKKQLILCNYKANVAKIINPRTLFLHDYWFRVTILFDNLEGSQMDS
jgi:hypothetical protein